MKKKKIYNSKTIRISLGDYASISVVSQRAGITFAEALHRLIEHQAQLPLLDMEIKPAPAAQVPGIPVPALRVAPVTSIAANGSKVAAFRIKPKGVRYD